MCALASEKICRQAEDLRPYATLSFSYLQILGMNVNGCQTKRNMELRRLDDRLLLVCTLGKAEVDEIRQLLRDGADIHAMRMPEGKTALHLAAHSGGLMSVKVRVGSTLISLCDPALRGATHDRPCEVGCTAWSIRMWSICCVCMCIYTYIQIYVCTYTYI